MGRDDAGYKKNGKRNHEKIIISKPVYYWRNLSFEWLLRSKTKDLNIKVIKRAFINLTRPEKSRHGIYSVYYALSLLQHQLFFNLRHLSSVASLSANQRPVAQFKDINLICSAQSFNASLDKLHTSASLAETICSHHVAPGCLQTVSCCTKLSSPGHQRVPQLHHNSRHDQWLL
jgi:hypothetical protein